MDSTNHGSKTVFLINGWDSEDVHYWLYALFYDILYQGFEHLRILVFAGGKANPPWDNFS